MPIVLARSITPNRPRRHRISTPGGWVAVERKLIGEDYLEVVTIPEGEGGKARALVVAHGFTPWKVAPAPEGTQGGEVTVDPPQAPDVQPDSSTAAPAAAEGNTLLAILDGTVKEVDDALDLLEADDKLTDADKLQLVIAERAGRNRKGVLRRLGVEVD